MANARTAWRRIGRRVAALAVMTAGLTVGCAPTTPPASVARRSVARVEPAGPRVTAPAAASPATRPVARAGTVADSGQTKTTAAGWRGTGLAGRVGAAAAAFIGLWGVVGVIDARAGRAGLRPARLTPAPRRRPIAGTDVGQTAP